MKSILIISFLFMSITINAGEFSKIDIAVREALETKFSEDSLDFYNDIYDLRIEEKTDNCSLIVSASVKLQKIVIRKRLCLSKTRYSYVAEVIEKE